MKYANLHVGTGLRSIFISVVFSFLASNAFAQSMPAESLYQGQTPPGNTPEIFAPDIISLNNRFESYPAFSPDGNEIFFTIVNSDWSQGKILHSQRRYGCWSEPDTAVFSKNSYINWESFISPDGNRQFFASNRPPSLNMDIWMVERKADSAWSNPIRLNNPVNSNAEDGSACVTNNGNLYFKSLRDGGTGGSWLYRAKLEGSSYSQVESLGNIIKTGPRETEPFIAGDESYLIFISETRAGGFGGWDLWISFKRKDNSWSDPVNMGADINSAFDEYGPRVSPDGNNLFFTREERGKTMDIYWVSTSLFNKLKNETLYK